MLLTEGDLLSFPYANDEWYFAIVKSLPTEEEAGIICTVEWQEPGEGDNAPEPMCLNNAKDGKAKIIIGQMLCSDVRTDQLVAMQQDAPLDAEQIIKRMSFKGMNRKRVIEVMYRYKSRIEAEE